MTQLAWRTAKDCNSSSCVEVAAAPGGVAIRDSKDPDGPVLSFDLAEFGVFVAGVRRGDFDDLLPPVEEKPHGFAMNTSAPVTVAPDPATWLTVEKL